MAEPGSGRRVGAWVTVAVLLVAALIGTVLWWFGPEDPEPEVAAPEPAATPAAQAVVDGTTMRSKCTVDPEPFTPVRVSVPDVTTGATVLALPRDGAGVPGVPPVSAKDVFAWDRPPGVSPGSDSGNVLLNAHTWPDGSALGNQLLAELEEGEQIVVIGDAGQRLCYRITERVEIPVEGGFPRYYEDIGSPQVAIIVCSGVRRGPGDWSHRTIWFGSPVGA